MPSGYHGSDHRRDFDRSTLDAIKNHYIYHYATEVDRFLETRWFHKRGLQYVLADQRLCSAFTDCIGPRSTGTTQEQIQAESRIFWLMMSKAMSIAAAKFGSSETDENVRDGLIGAAKKSALIQIVLSWNHLEGNPLPHPISPTWLGDPLEQEALFWSALGQIVSVRDDTELALGQARTLLDGKQYRDLIYSIAVVRHLHGRVTEIEMSSPSSMDENLPGNRLRVARAFLGAQASIQRGAPSMARCMSFQAVQKWPQTSAIAPSRIVT